MLRSMLKAAWILITASVLLVTLLHFDGKVGSDIGVFLVWSMLMLTFPIGIACALLFSAGAY